jgi:flavin reductase (DIM6/NTAB) family NADH-FMN oxidoreductase RutF
MTEIDYQIKAPVSWLPAGLISWYAPEGNAVALVTSWVALIGGDEPRIRMAWHGRDDPVSRLWPGGDFVFNVPSASGLKTIRDLMRQGKLCLDVGADLQQTCMRGTSTAAPCLTGSTVQLECVGGTLSDSGYDMELKGEVVLLHRAGVTVRACQINDLCAIQPLSPLSIE